MLNNPQTLVRVEPIDVDPQQLVRAARGSETKQAGGKLPSSWDSRGPPSFLPPAPTGNDDYRLQQLKMQQQQQQQQQQHYPPIQPRFAPPRADALPSAVPESTGTAPRTSSAPAAGNSVIPLVPREGSTSVVVFKWEKAWLCLSPEAAETFVPGILGSSETGDDNTKRDGSLRVPPAGTGAGTSTSSEADDDEDKTLEIAEEDDEEDMQVDGDKASDQSKPASRQAQPGVAVGDGVSTATSARPTVDAANTHVMWNNKDGICRVMPLQAMIRGWRRCTPQFVFLSQRNEDGLFDTLFREVFPNNLDRLPHFNLVGAVDSCSTSSRALEQRLLLVHRINVPTRVLADLVRTTRQEIAERDRARQAAAAATTTPTGASAAASAEPAGGASRMQQPAQSAAQKRKKTARKPTAAVQPVVGREPQH
eukprot:TRINITY_DN1128_c0_g1_i2.p1 TRINITY_DN1128_c0_g1~~TRINITY_DN1128_c0_g1_i2.p1  ORF type:complete len:422 (-),score=104.31 TRINITY_DN1128_c0_g1_i2:1421-2686(-)